jgi:hypothetical protein
MNHRRHIACAIGALAIVGSACSPSATPRPVATEAVAAAASIVIPQSIKAEHDAIHAALVEATQASGQVGVAAKELAEVLHPHFVREEQIALPPLGLLGPLAANAPVPDSTQAAILAMTDALEAELPRMMEEHKGIRAAVEKLLAAARAEQATAQVELAEQLAMHAQTEEEVLYPAAILVGEIIRARSGGK